MTGDDRTEWLKVAQMTLADIPADLLARGCEVARRTCDHPSKIVPAILGEIEIAWKNRRDRPAMSNVFALPAPEPDDSPLVDPAEVRALLKSLGAA